MNIKTTSLGTQAMFLWLWDIHWIVTCLRAASPESSCWRETFLSFMLRF